MAGSPVSPSVLLRISGGVALSAVTLDGGLGRCGDVLATVDRLPLGSVVPRRSCESKRLEVISNIKLLDADRFYAGWIHMLGNDLDMHIFSYVMQG